ncbi:hypothetical protein LOK49_LG03G03885 [Camellia lanceoleosa]|uniref:Uncharacterized protein n=1 Tax=Camellia lanceoleosa TaxID=1840588 RepID=A0ACC0IDR7_9ERIC|nr:hypothetical protein LOK49_LG03G03885 [Camellia lanceoleosa]
MSALYMKGVGFMMLRNLSKSSSLVSNQDKTSSSSSGNHNSRTESSATKPTLRWPPRGGTTPPPPPPPPPPPLSSLNTLSLCVRFWFLVEVSNLLTVSLKQPLKNEPTKKFLSNSTKQGTYHLTAKKINTNL